MSYSRSVKCMKGASLRRTLIILHIGSKELHSDLSSSTPSSNWKKTLLKFFQFKQYSADLDCWNEML